MKWWFVVSIYTLFTMTEATKQRSISTLDIDVFCFGCVLVCLCMQALISCFLPKATKADFVFYEVLLCFVVFLYSSISLCDVLFVFMQSSLLYCWVASFSVSFSLFSSLNRVDFHVVIVELNNRFYRSRRKLVFFYRTSPLLRISFMLFVFFFNLFIYFIPMILYSFVGAFFRYYFFSLRNMNWNGF